MRTTTRWVSLGAFVFLGCSGDDGGGNEGETATSATGDASTSGSATATSTSTSTSTSTTTASSTGPGTGETSGADSTGTTGGPTGPMVDVSDPQLYSFSFTADEADPQAAAALGTQLAYLDTRVEPIGKLVVYLHGAGVPSTCGSSAMGEVLAAMGYHVVMPCYVSDYGVGNCGDDIGGCRLEAFEGVDHTDVIDIAPSDSAEVRVMRALEYLQDMHAGGDWQYFIDGDAPRWDEMVISGISHGASSSGVIGMNRVVDRVVMLSGPLDSGQAWLLGAPMTSIDRFYAFTHSDDGQHDGHLQSFEDMGLLGQPVVVDDMDPPYGDSHRLVSGYATGNGHTAVQAGGSSPMENGAWVYQPVWDYMYGVGP